jgi:hypothetical protein
MFRLIESSSGPDCCTTMFLAQICRRQKLNVLTSLYEYKVPDISDPF